MKDILGKTERTELHECRVIAGDLGRMILHGSINDFLLGIEITHARKAVLGVEALRLLEIEKGGRAPAQYHGYVIGVASVADEATVLTGYHDPFEERRDYGHEDSSLQSLVTARLLLESDRSDTSTKPRIHRLIHDITDYENTVVRTTSSGDLQAYDLGFYFGLRDVLAGAALAACNSRIDS